MKKNSKVFWLWIKYVLIPKSSKWMSYYDGRVSKFPRVVLVEFVPFCRSLSWDFWLLEKLRLRTLRGRGRVLLKRISSGGFTRSWMPNAWWMSMILVPGGKYTVRLRMRVWVICRSAEIVCVGHESMMNA